jgi:hypothetical protein
MEQNQKLILTVLLFGTMFVIWQALGIRYFYNGDLTGGIIYSIVGFWWVVIGIFNTKNVAEGKKWFV